MRIRVQAADEQSYRELKYRLFDIWDEETYTTTDDAELCVTILNPPTALIRELTEDCGYTVNELQPTAGV